VSALDLEARSEVLPQHAAMLSRSGEKHVSCVCVCVIINRDEMKYIYYNYIQFCCCVSDVSVGGSAGDVEEGPQQVQHYVIGSKEDSEFGS